MLRLLLLVLLSVSIAIPEAAFAGSHAPFPPAGFSRRARPVCAGGVRGGRCFAPIRRTARFVGRAGFFAVRAVGRVAFGAVRLAGRAVGGTARFVGRAARGVFRGVGGVIRGTGRLLFGRRFF